MVIIEQIEHAWAVTYLSLMACLCLNVIYQGGQPIDFPGLISLVIGPSTIILSCSHIIATKRLVFCGQNIHSFLMSYHHRISDYKFYIWSTQSHPPRWGYVKQLQNKVLRSWVHWLRVCLDIAYYWKLKHHSKIIFKCVNSTVGPSFKVVFLGKKKEYLRVPWTVHETHKKRWMPKKCWSWPLSKHTLNEEDRFCHNILATDMYFMQHKSNDCSWEWCSIYLLLYMV